MEKKSFKKDWQQFPEPYQGVQTNFCKFTTCTSFGIEPEEAFDAEVYENSNIKSTDRQPSKRHPLYTTTGIGKGGASLICKACKARKLNGEVTPYSYSMKSNLAIIEEFNRIKEYLYPRDLACTNNQCISNTDPTISLNLKNAVKLVQEDSVTNVRIVAPPLLTVMAVANRDAQRLIVCYSIC